MVKKTQRFDGDLYIRNEQEIPEVVFIIVVSFDGKSGRKSRTKQKFCGLSDRASFDSNRGVREMCCVSTRANIRNKITPPQQINTS